MSRRTLGEDYRAIKQLLDEEKNRTASVTDPVLCYVDGHFAFFTTQALKKQWGDDWDDAPYEHNAGEPYLPGVYHYADGRNEPMERDYNPDGTPKWSITKVAWDGPFETPNAGHTNSLFSVEQINAGASAWLIRTLRTQPGTGYSIPAGTPLSKFITLIKEAGGQVYLPQ